MLDRVQQTLQVERLILRELADVEAKDREGDLVFFSM